MLESTFSTQFSGLIDQLGARFSRRDLLRQAESFLRGLLSQVERKNSWQLTEAAGADTPHGFQRLLGRARWNADEVRDDLQRYVVEHLGDSDRVPKKECWRRVDSADISRGATVTLPAGLSAAMPST